MNKTNRLRFLAALIACLFILGSATAQRSDNTDRFFDESQGIKHRLWYGGGVALGFSGTNISSLFQFGLSPLIGFKITENISAGPRFSVLYSHYRQDIGFDQVARANLFDYGVGAFARVKVVRGFFAHLEYGADYEEFPTDLNSSGTVFNTGRSLRNNGYIGVGYNDSVSVWGYDIYMLYNVLLPESSFRSPLDLRFGITYNF